MDLALNNIQRLICHKTQTASQLNLFRLHLSQNTVNNIHTKNIRSELKVIRLYVVLEVNGTKTRFKIDSGSQVKIIPKKYYQLLKNYPGLKPIRTRLTYNGTSIPVLGKYAVQIPDKNKTYDVPISVYTDASPILGLKTSVAMHLIKNFLSISKGEPVFLSNFKDCFGELTK